MDDLRDRLSVRQKFTIDLSKFKVISKINSGGFGNIYSVEDKTSKKQYAAKVINCDNNASGQRSFRFKIR